MKKKLMSLLSLILAVIMVFPAAVFAVDPTPTPPSFEITAATTTIYAGSTTKNTTQLSVPNYYTNVVWGSQNPEIADVNDGVVTAVAEGTATIKAFDMSSGAEDTIQITVVNRAFVSYTVGGDFKKVYVSGEKFNKTNLTITATFNDGTETYSGSQITVKNDVPLTAGTNQTVVVTAGGRDYEVEGINVAEKKVESIAFVSAKQSYTAGESISDVKIRVYYNDGSQIEMTSGFTLSINRALTVEDNNASVTVTYEGKTTNFTIVVAANTTPTPDETNWTYKAVVTTRPTKTSYSVGETFDPAGMKVSLVRVNGNITETLASNVSVSSTGLAEFTSATTTSVTFNITATVSIGGVSTSKTFSCLVDNLTVISKDTRNIKSVDNVVLVNSKYSVGKVFSKEDISYIQVTFVDGYRDYIRASEFDSYAFMDSINLLVLNAQGKDKTTNWSTIEQSDILVDTKTGAKSVRLALYYRKYASTTSSVATQGVYAPTTFVVGIDEPDIAFWAGSTMKGEFTDLELALDATVNGSIPTIGNPNAPTISLGATDRVTLVLGKDTSVSKYYGFSPSRYVTIDLNGNDLVFYSDTVSIPTNSRYELVITNSSDTPATFTYADKGIELTVTKGNGFAFEYGKELPGFYTVSITAGSYGKVTASPSLDKDNKVEAPMGSTVEIMITPNNGYEVFDVVVEGKSVKNDKENYSLKENTGVVIYKLTDVSEDTEVVVTFQAKKSQWKNPFRDVKETDDYCSAVEFVNTNELFQGTSNTTFAPNNTMTRAMFVTVLGRLAGIDEATAAKEYGYTSDFKDVSASNNRITYAVPYIKWAVENGIIEGYGDGNFGPENPITHQQMYLMMYRYTVFVEGKAVSTSGVSLSGISDRGSVADWAETGVKMAKKYDFLVYTTGSRIEPTAVAKRHELAQLLEKYCANVLEWEAK